MPKFLWTQRTGFGPSARIACAMAFDSKRGRSVLFGGDGLGDLSAETWEWDGSFWTQMNDIGPTPRRDTAMAYDSANQVTLLFGGRSAQGLLGDTWQWDGQDWTQLSASGPPPRAAHALAYDSARKRTVLFGGADDKSFFADTWEFDGTEWTQQEDSGPAARVSHAMAYDVVKSRVLLFGGGPDGSSALGDTWSWDGASWIRIAEIGPPARLAGAMVSPGGSVILFGGISSTAPEQLHQVFADTWEFDGKLWTQRQDIGPGARWSLAMAFDSTRNRVVLFGGIRVFEAGDDVAARPQLLGDTWEHTAPAVAAQPPPDTFVQTIELSPRNVPAGDTVFLRITLAIAVAVQVPVLVALVPSDEVGSANQPGLVNLPAVLIPAATPVFTTQFVAPSPAQQWVVFAQVSDPTGALTVPTATLIVT